MSYYEKLSHIRSNFLDDESKRIFDARLQYVFDHDWVNFFENTRQESYHQMRDFKDFYEKECGGKVVIYGCGMYGKYAAKLFDACGISILGFGDSNPERWGVGLMKKKFFPMRLYWILIENSTL